MSEEITQTAPTTQTQSTSTEPTTVTDNGESTEQITTYVNGKFNSVSELEKSYESLHSKFGSFTGSPEEYSIAEGTEINNEHPILAEIQTFGKENNLSNEGYQNLVNVLLNNERINQEEMQAQSDQVKKDLGANANERIQNIDDFVNANLEVDDRTKGLIDMAKDQPGGVELIEAFIGMTKKTGLAKEEVATPIKTYNKEELHKMQFANDEYGNRKMNDASYRKTVEDYSAKLLAQG